MLAPHLAADIVPGDGNAFAGCHDAITATGSGLESRAKEEGTSSPDTEIRDVLRLVDAIAGAGQQVPR